MSYFDDIKHKVAKRPDIVSTYKYVIVGSMDHGLQISQDSAVELIKSLKDVQALKSAGSEKAYEKCHPLSTEVLTKVAVGQVPISYFREKDHEDIGQKLLNYGVPQEVAEVFVPCMHLHMFGTQIPPDFLEKLPIAFLQYKREIFGFIDVTRGSMNFIRLLDYCGRHDLEDQELYHFWYDFEKYMGGVREYEFWRLDLEEFRLQNDGRVAVCCGAYHVPFVKSVLDGEEQTPPYPWSVHLDYRREDVHSP